MTWATSRSNRPQDDECSQPVAKLSDAPGKTMSTDAGYLRYLRQVFGLEPAEKI